MSNMIEINGLKCNGLNAASKTIPLQFRYLINEYNEISNCFQATINTQLDRDLIILKPDKRTSPIKWAINMPEEVFDFVKIRLFIPRLDIELDAWIYLAHKSPHRKNYNFHELICEKIDNLNDCENIKIRINKNFVILPYDESKVYIV